MGSGLKFCLYYAVLDYSKLEIALNPIFQLQDFLRISHNFQYCGRMEKVLQLNMKEGQSILDSWKEFLMLQEFFYPENNESVCIKFAHFFHSLKHKLYQKNSHHFELQFLSFRNSHHLHVLANWKDLTFHTLQTQLFLIGWNL